MVIGKILTSRLSLSIFFFNDTATTEIYTLSLHDALPISAPFLSSAVLELFSALGVALVAVYIGFHLLGYLKFGAWGRQLDLAEALFILLLAPAFFEPLRELAEIGRAHV